MAREEEVTLQSELLYYLRREQFVELTITLSSGVAFKVRDPSEVTVGSRMITIDPRDNSHSFFRLLQISHVEVEPDVE